MRARSLRLGHARRRPGAAHAATFALALAGALALAALAAPREALAQDRAAAARHYADGVGAYTRGDWVRAGEEFEAAYAAAPHEDALWNAARAWHHAGELARAANRYAAYLAVAPPGARDRNSANAALVQLAKRLGRLDVQTEGVEAVEVDGQPLEGATLYVEPGAHVVTARRGAEALRQTPKVAAGQALSVAFSEPEAAVAPAAPPPSPPPPSRATPASGSASGAGSGSGWSPIVVVAGGAIAVALGVATTVSAVDTRATRKDFDAAPSEEKLESGRAKEVRTNVLLAATGVVTLATAAAAVWLVDWRSPRARESAAVAPYVDLGPDAARAGLRGTF